MQVSELKYYILKLILKAVCQNDSLWNVPLYECTPLWTQTRLWINSEIDPGLGT